MNCLSARAQSLRGRGEPAPRRARLARCGEKLSTPAKSAGAVRFGTFEVDLAAGELRKSDRRVKIQEQPFRILVLLLERPGEIVTREYLIQRLWPDGTFVDYEHSVNTAIRKLREALGDDPDTPRFVETIPRRGYRFIGPVERVEQAGSAGISKPTTWSDSALVREDEGFWVAVLPFKHKGSDAELEALTEGIAEEIITGLLRFSYLRVIARSSTKRFSSESGDARTIGKELGARYLMEGSLREAGSRLRIGVQLVDTGSGAHLWAETYERSFAPDSLFELQDDIVPRVVSTVADIQGVLPRNMTEALRNHDPKKLTPYEALLRSFGHHQRLTATEHAVARDVLERAVQLPPDRGDCWAMLSWLYREEYTHGFNPRPDPLGRALTAARRAVDAAPTNHLAHAALATTLFFYRELGAFRAAAERSLALNSMDGLTAAYLGFLIAYSGDWERGCALAERAIQLNPNSPGWYRFPLVLNAYRTGNYEQARDLVLKVNMPAFWRTQLMLAVCNAQLGELDAARNAVQELLKIRPNFLEVWHEELSKWWDAKLVEHLVDGLRKAGLDIGGSDGETIPTNPATP